MAAIDGPAGPVVAGDHLRRDRALALPAPPTESAPLPETIRHDLEWPYGSMIYHTDSIYVYICVRSSRRVGGNALQK